MGIMKVMTRNSVLEFLDTDLGTAEIAQRLGAAFLLTGSVQRAGDRLRINVHLADARDDETVWTNTFDETWSIDNLLDIQARIAEEIASEQHAFAGGKECDHDAGHAQPRGVRVLPARRRGPVGRLFRGDHARRD